MLNVDAKTPEESELDFGTWTKTGELSYALTSKKTNRSFSVKITVTSIGSTMELDAVKFAKVIK